MGQIKVMPTQLEGLYVVEPKAHGDARGYFIETYNQKDFYEWGLKATFVQDNQSSSVRGVLRGLHFQKEYPQVKLVRVVNGSVFDVAVDLRPESSSFKRWFGVELSAENHKQLYIPEGFAHGFLVLSARAELCYKVADFYHPDDEGGLAWNDPELGVRWPGVVGEFQGSSSADGYLMNGEPLLLSEKDQRQPMLAEVLSEKITAR